MTTTLGTLITEEGTAKITYPLTDESGSAATPKTATWTLSTPSGVIINSLEDVVPTLASTLTIVLSGPDLAIGANGLDRVLTIKWTYDSSAGTDLLGNDELLFTLENRVNVPQGM